MMGLRLSEGLDLARLGGLGPEILARARPLSAEGLLTFDGPALKATARGRLLLNAVTAELLG
jgi:coproporphyrinogen III oxidase-like Fe-S oxidoreductase